MRVIAMLLVLLAPVVAQEGSKSKPAKKKAGSGKVGQRKTKSRKGEVVVEEDFTQIEPSENE